MGRWWVLISAVSGWSLLLASTATAQDAVSSYGAAVRQAGAERTRERAVRNVEQAIAKLGVAAGQAEAAATALASATPAAPTLQPMPGWFDRLVLPEPGVTAIPSEIVAAADRSRQLAGTLRTVQGTLAGSLSDARELPAEQAVRELARVPIPEAALTVIREGTSNPDPFSPYVISYSNENYRMTLDYPSIGSLMLSKARDESSVPIFSPVCSATLVAENVLITAAHCFCEKHAAAECKVPNNVSVDINSADNIDNWRIYLPHVGVVKIRSVIINQHYKYFDKTTLRDLAVVVINQPIGEIRPMTVAAATGAVGQLTAVGFGRYSRPFQVASVLNFAGPSSEMGVKAVAPIHLGSCAPHHAEMLCWHYAGGHSDGSICSGDSGGSLLDGDGLLAAVLNGGTGLDANGVPTCQTENDAWATSLGVEENREWIKRMIAENDPGVGAIALSDALNPFSNSRSRFLVDRIYPSAATSEQADEPFDVIVPVKRLVISLNASRAVDATGRPFTLLLSVTDPTGAERCKFAGRQQAHVCEMSVTTLGRYKVATSRGAYQDLQLGVVGFTQ